MWGALTSLVGGIIGSKSADKATDAQVRAAELGIASQEKMFDRSLEIQAPYREAGYGALTGLQGLVDPEQRAITLSDYYKSDEYAMLEDQAQQSTLRSAAATGNLRGGSGAAAIGTIAPQLGLNYLTDMQNQYTGLANMGMGAASQGANAANNLGFNTAQQYNNIGIAEAQGALAKGNIWGNVVGDIGGMGMDFARQLSGAM